MPAWRYLGRARGCRRRAPILGRPEASYGESRACLRGLCPVCVRHLSISRCTIRFRRCTILLICSNLVRRTFSAQQAPRWFTVHPSRPWSPPCHALSATSPPVPHAGCTHKPGTSITSPVRPRSRGPGPRLGTGPGPSGTPSLIVRHASCRVA